MARKSLSMLGPFYLDFNKNPYSYVLIPIAIAQLLLYLATAKDNIIPAIMFVVMLVLVGKYTNDATYKLGIPMIVTFIIIRYDILKQNFWEGLEERDEEEMHKESSSEEKDHDDMDDDTRKRSSSEEKEDTHKRSSSGEKEDTRKRSSSEEKEDTRKASSGEKEDKGEKLRKLLSGDDEEEEDTGRSGFTNYNSNGVESTIDKIDNTLERLERSYDRIMKVGSKLGMGSEMNSLSKSLDVTGILNQKKKLA
jgi:hypothetical protein